MSNIINLFDEYGITPLAEEGKWFDLVSTGDTSERPRIKVRSDQSEFYDKIMTRLAAQNQEALERSKTNDQSADRMRTMAIHAIAEGIIADWENVSLDGKECVEYSVDNAIRLLSKLKPLRTQIETWARDLSSFKEEAQRD